MTTAVELWGSLAPVVTPFREGAVDFDSFAALVGRQFDQGSHGVVVTGTSGEPTSLNADERIELYRAATEAARGRGPVVAATGSANQAEALRLTAAAEGAGADAVLVVCPAFVKPSQRGLVEHFTRVFAATSLPAMIYHIPGRAAVGVTTATVARIASSSPNLVGLKAASPDLDFVTELLFELGNDFRIFCGVESLSYPMLALGAAGLMNAIANLAPGPVAELCEAVRDGDHGRALELHRGLFTVNRAVFFDTNPIPLKAMLAAREIGSAEVRPPLAQLDEETHRRVMEALATLPAPTDAAPGRAGAWRA
ncbi:MAG: 4-hydroxy-tetrahydrodipicolinate synthase [Actinobacteria bacterium]|nr:4-hydroxy-tetrahydrodipicolinate synthase [Actinomycetota bacterium]